MQRTASEGRDVQPRVHTLLVSSVRKSRGLGRGLVAAANRELILRSHNRHPLESNAVCRVCCLMRTWYVRLAL